MTHPSPGDPRAYDDPTRDISLPPLPDRPPAALPRAWVQQQRPDVSSPPPDLPPQVVEADAPEPVPPASPVADQPTDKLPPRSPPREPTLAFSSPEMRQRPVRPVQVGRSPRRWPWVVLAVLPILVIAGAGVTWLLLLRAM